MAVVASRMIPYRTLHQQRGMPSVNRAVKYLFRPVCPAALLRSQLFVASQKISKRFII